jgi:hypothetical protein
MAQWPDGLPKPLINSTNEGIPDTLLKTQMDKGPPKRRNRTSANIAPYSYSMKLKPAALDILIDFYKTTLSNGADSFSYTHPRTGEVIEAQFAEPPTWGDIEGGIVYNVSISLEILP